MSMQVSFQPTNEASYVDWITGRRLHEMLFGTLMVFGAIRENRAELAQLRARLLDNPRNSIINIPTIDGLDLEAVLMRAEIQPAKGIIVFTTGLGGCYEKTAQDNDLAKDLVEFFKSHVGNDLDILVINQRGVCQSEGIPTFRGWEKDVYSVLKYVQAQGYKRIMHYGHSMGGWTSRNAIRTCKKEARNCKIVEVSDRSFGDFAQAAKHYCGAGILGNAAYYFTSYCKWQGNVEPKNLNDSRAFVIWAPDDNFVKKPASLYKSLENNRSFIRAARNEERVFRLPGNVIPHVRAFTPREKSELGPRLRKFMGL